MNDGTKLYVTEEDVERCLGLPRGPLKLVKRKPANNKELVDEWKSHIGRGDRGFSSRPNELLNSIFFSYDEYDAAPPQEVLDARMERYKDYRCFVSDIIVLFFFYVS